MGAQGDCIFAGKKRDELHNTTRLSPHRQRALTDHSATPTPTPTPIPTRHPLHARRRYLLLRCCILLISPKVIWTNWLPCHLLCRLSSILAISHSSVHIFYNQHFILISTHIPDSSKSSLLGGIDRYTSLYPPLLHPNLHLSFARLLYPLSIPGVSKQ